MTGVICCSFFYLRISLLFPFIELLWEFLFVVVSNINWFHTFMYIGSTQLRELKQLYDETDAARRTLQRQYDKLKHTR